MRFTGLALVASAIVLGACGGGDSTTDSTAVGASATATPANTTPAGGNVAAAPATGQTHTVRMTGDGTNYKFEPENITIKAGDKIQWIMVSGGPHNVAFDPMTFPAAAKPQMIANMPEQMGELSGKLLSNPNETYEISFANIPAGKYEYICTPHLAMNMKGTVTVQ